MGFEGPPQIKKVEKLPEPITPPSEEVIESKLESREQQAEIITEAQEARGGIAKNLLTSEIVSNGLDVLPFAGSGKMVVEAVYGGTLSGRELSGKDRIIHGAMGAGMLALDFTGVGEAIELGGKAIPLVEKIGASLAEKGAIKGAAIFTKTAEFMGRHPELTAKAEAYAEGELRGVITQIKDYQKETRPVQDVSVEEPVIESSLIPGRNLNDNKAVEKESEKSVQQEAIQEVATESPSQTETEVVGRESRDFSKKYGSLARNVLAGQLRHMKAELSQGRSGKQESLQQEILEKENNLGALEQEYSQLEQELNDKKSSFVSRLFKRTELSKLEQNLQERKATLDEVKKDITERQQLLSEVSGLAGAEQDRTEVRKKLDEFYKDQAGLNEQFEKEQGARSVEEISKKEGVLFIHAMSLAGEVQNGSEYNNSVINGGAVDIKTKLKLIMGLEPTLSCSTIKNGDTRNEM